MSKFHVLNKQLDHLLEFRNNLEFEEVEVELRLRNLVQRNLEHKNKNLWHCRSHVHCKQMNCLQERQNTKFEVEKVKFGIVVQSNLLNMCIGLLLCNYHALSKPQEQLQECQNTRIREVVERMNVV